MPERKQSFLERLTGMQTLPEGGNADSDGPDGKPWSHAIYEDGPVEKADSDELAYADNKEEEDALDEEIPGMAIDMYELDNEIIIQSMIAGITPENLHISVTRDVVTLGGRRLSHNVPDDRYHTRELYWGEFSRTIELPFPIDTDGAEAVEKYGLLIIRLPRLDVNRSQELKVKSIQ